MAIREVLTSFTFEQQRQMINLIGDDVGDVSLLLTPTKEVVSGINEIVNGDVDLINQTHGMDDGTLASPSLYWDAGQGFYKVDATKLGLSTSLAIAGNLEVDGDITFRAGNGTGGTLTFGDLNTDNIIFNADVQSSIIPDSTANYNLGSTTKQWNDLWIDGTASIDTLTVDENATITGNLTVSSGNVYVPSTQTVVDLFDDYATTVEAFGAGTSVRLGATSGTLTLRNPTIVGTQTSISLFNTVATTVNAFGAASEIFVGVTLGGGPGTNSNFTIRSDDTILIGDLNVNGGEILSSQNTFDLLINNSDVRVGAANGSGNTTINNSLIVKENLDLSNSGTNIFIKDNLANSLVVKEGNNSYMTFTTTDAGERIIVHKDLYIVGNLDVTGSNTIINTSTLSVDDKNITLADTAAPTDALADGGGITLKGTTDKTFNYVNSTGRWTTNIGLTVGGSLVLNEGLSLKTNKTITLGDLNEASISWDGSQLLISETGTFGVNISTSQFIASSSTGEFMINAIENSSVYLYYDNDKKIETTSAGVTVSGTTSIKPPSNTYQLKIEQDNSTDGWKFWNDGPGGGQLYIQRELSGVDTNVITLNSDGKTIFNQFTEFSKASTFATASDTTDADTVIDGSLYSMYHKQVSFTADRTIQVSNLITGRKVTIWVRNTSGSTRNITFQASDTSTSFSNVLISTGIPNLSTAATFSVPPSTGTICVTIMNIGGNIVGSMG